MLLQTRRPYLLILAILVLLSFVALTRNNYPYIRTWPIRSGGAGDAPGSIGDGQNKDGDIPKDDRFKIDPSKYLRSISNINDTSISRLSCPSANIDRYGYLRTLHDVHSEGGVIGPPPYRPYFFALNLHQSIKVLPRLLGSIVEVIRILGPENCALSIVEGRSTDGTYEVLTSLKSVLPREVEYYFLSSPLDPTTNGRIETLAKLRNLAIQPLQEHAALFSANQTNIIFFNDVLACPDDVLELVHQKVAQHAHMTCAMDWNWVDYSGAYHLTFYDVWIARSMSGNSFFHIPHGGSWNESMLLFPFATDADRLAKARYTRGLPFQVFSCWNGGVVFSAAPLMQGVRFRVNRPGECYQGEVSLFTKDLWLGGYGRIAVVPAVNLAYKIKDAGKIREIKGVVGDSVRRNEGHEAALVPWKEKPPEQMLCIPDWVRQPQTWVPWND